MATEFEEQGDKFLDAVACHHLVEDADDLAPQSDGRIASNACVCRRRDAVGDGLHQVVEARDAAPVDQQQGGSGRHEAERFDV